MDLATLNELCAILPNALRQDRRRIESQMEHWEQGGRGAAGQLARAIHEARRSVQLRHLRHERVPQIEYPQNLPITAKKEEIVAAIKAHPVVIIAGETGSGKTTQIPKMCLEAGFGVEGKVGCTQPRRLAALSISKRIAEELEVGWGKEVGCKIRFSDRSSPETYIKLMTDGILLAETQGDRDLNEYDAIVIDEAHERSLNIDFLLGHLKLLLQRRADLKLIITSATIDTEAFSQAFGHAPIIEVSGRVYPVEVRYAPHDPDAEESGDLTYIDAAVSAVETVLIESNSGDILIFMPSERDIRETEDDLEGRFGSEAEIVPLFGRLTAGEQDRVFAPSARRKIIVATNIAETSLTIPGIRYVIDPGLARFSRYSPRTRTRRLPIEAISQSSANQRAGRSGRVENGTCIRLYSEGDFAERPRFTQPEIQRANLAEVILKMKAWRLGEMETFPFINPPQHQAIQAGYQLLEELGALNAERQLTTLGHDLARLPVDPAIGRMILQSAREGAREEVLVIAAGLSIQDPRERPLDRQEAADQAHRQFVDLDSDFLTLLNIWNAYHEKVEALRKQNQMRKFCKANFLSFTRMREWIDIHAQLRDALSGMRLDPPRARDCSPRPGQEKDPAARYAAIHRSILSGLLGHVAQRTERNLYRASGQRQVMPWPGSSLFERNGKTEKGRAQPPAAAGQQPEKTRQPRWIVAGEMVETSRLFARTIAGIRADWIAELGAHICKRKYAAPHWDRKTGRVLALERISLFGLEVLERHVDYGRVNPKEATEIFIRSALLEEQIDSPPRFLAHNRKLQQKIEAWRTHVRNQRLPDAQQALFGFYARHLQNVSSVHDLNRLLRERSKAAPNFLHACERDLTGGVELAWDASSFPHEIELARQSVRLEYAYAPGQEHDGITLQLPVALAHRLDPDVLDWIVPGLREEQVEFLLKALPKSLRVPLMPLAPKAKELAAALRPETGLEGLRRLIQEKYKTTIPAGAWQRELLPDHLRPRLAIIGSNQKMLASGRDLAKLKHGLEQHETPAEQQSWASAAQRWERFDLRSWTFGDLPESIEVTRVASAPLCAFPGLESDGPAVHLKLFRKPEDAERASGPGFMRMVEFALAKELAWAQRDLRAITKAPFSLPSPEEFLIDAYENLKRHLIKLPQPVLPLRQARFEKALHDARQRLPDSGPGLVDSLKSILRLRQEVISHRAFPSQRQSPPPKAAAVTDLQQLGVTPKRPASRALNFMSEELEWLLPKNFLRFTPFERLPRLSHYLKALLVRADRALLNPSKDLEKAGQIQPFVQALNNINRNPPHSREARRALSDFRWMIEEFKVSVFAQELGTAQPISAKRLEAQLQLVRATS
jgi:ATP-dependent helicase HrpA